ncbi:MAG: rRNA maturation RNase YbeY [Elusimicrobiota bacterium]
MNILLSGADRMKPAERRLIERAVRAALGPRGRRRGELCVILIDDRGIRRINKRFLGRDSVTDVISFPYTDDRPKQTRARSGGGRSRMKDSPPQFIAPPRGGGADMPFGDIFIARGAARRQARAMGHSPLTEILTLAVHGALHLVGYDHRRPADARRMLARQERIVRRLSPDPASTPAGAPCRTPSGKASAAGAAHGKKKKT